MKHKLKLYGVYLGGKVEGCNIESHDFVFSVGKTIEDTFEYLHSRWFGLKKGLHIDSWVELSHIDGYDVFICEPGTPNEIRKNIYFINIGGYIDDVFSEVHRNTFVVAESETRARYIAKNNFDKLLLLSHVDNSYKVDDCIEAKNTENYSIVLNKCQEKNITPTPLKFNNGLIKVRL